MLAVPCPAMARADRRPKLRPGAEVVAAVDLPEVPAGTPGRVVIVNGLTWLRAWVRFANGVSVGSVGGDKLATPAEWERRLAGGDDTPAAAGAAAGPADDAGASDGGGEGVAVNGVVVPAKLIERTRAARARLSA